MNNNTKNQDQKLKEIETLIELRKAYIDQITAMNIIKQKEVVRAMQKISGLSNVIKQHSTSIAELDRQIEIQKFWYNHDMSGNELVMLIVLE
jgi:hypothetical protein